MVILISALQPAVAERQVKHKKDKNNYSIRGDNQNRDQKQFHTLLEESR
jgi:hypothetical protein